MEDGLKEIPIIMLDIDGCLNSHEWYMSDDNPGNIEDNDGEIDPKAIQRINYLIEKTGAKIVMSSSWRLDYETSCKRLYKAGLTPDSIIDKTPIFADKLRHKYGTVRGNEIAQWFQEFYPKQCWWQLKKYVIFDDINDMLFQQRNNFICVNYLTGITDKDINKAIKILK